MPESPFGEPVFSNPFSTGDSGGLITPFFMLMETGDRMLLETGDDMLLEVAT